MEWNGGVEYWTGLSECHAHYITQSIDVLMRGSNGQIITVFYGHIPGELKQ